MARRPFYQHSMVPSRPDDVRVAAPGYLQVNTRSYSQRAMQWLSAQGAEPHAGYESMRRSQPCNILLPATRRWLEGLPREVRPLQLARDFARIANSLATAWGNRHDVEVVLGNLIVDRRGDRKGFPKPVEEELIHLWHYWQWNSDAPHGGVSARQLNR